MNFDDETKTLTCTSSGGPATTVTWRQNCVVLQRNNPDFAPSQMVTNTETATYQNTLVISSADPNGVYTCSVTNRRGYSTSSTGIGSEYTSL